MPYKSSFYSSHFSNYVSEVSPSCCANHMTVGNGQTARVECLLCNLRTRITMSSTTQRLSVEVQHPQWLQEHGDNPDPGWFWGVVLANKPSRNGGSNGRGHPTSTPGLYTRERNHRDTCRSTPLTTTHVYNKSKHLHSVGISYVLYILLKYITLLTHLIPKLTLNYYHQNLIIRKMNTKF